MYELTSGSASIDDYRSALEDALKRITELESQQTTEVTKERKQKRNYVLTPYQAAKIMNEERSNLNLNPVTPQMLYTYARKGYFVVTKTEDGRKQVDPDSFYTWMRKHNSKNS